MHALGIASQQSAGIMEVVAGTGSDLRALYAGFSARGAVTAALLAERGLTRRRPALRGTVRRLPAPTSAATTTATRCSPTWAATYGAATRSTSCWPSVGTSHSHIHATIELIAEHDLSLDDIEEIRVFVGDYHELMCTPLAVATRARRRSSTPSSASRSSSASPPCTRRGAGRATSPRRASATLGSGAAAQGRPRGGPRPRLDLRAAARPRVEIVTTDGRTLLRTVPAIPAVPDRPTTWDQLSQKFRDCASVAAHPPGGGRIESFIDAVRRLEDMPDVRDLVGWLR